MEASLSQSFLVVKNSRPQESCKDLCSSNVGLVPPLKPPMQALPNVRILFTALVQIPRRAAGAHLDPLQAQGSDQRRSLVPRYRQLQRPGQFSRWLLKVSLKKVNSQKLKTLFGLMRRCPPQLNNFCASSCIGAAVSVNRFLSRFLGGLEQKYLCLTVARNSCSFFL